MTAAKNIVLIHPTFLFLLKTIYRHRHLSSFADTTKGFVCRVEYLPSTSSFFLEVLLLLKARPPLWDINYMCSSKMNWKMNYHRCRFFLCQDLSFCEGFFLFQDFCEHTSVRFLFIFMHCGVKSYNKS